jgi:cytochrome c
MKLFHSLWLTSLGLVAAPVLGAQESKPTALAGNDPDPTRFETTTLVSALDRPMELTVTPDGRVLWIELGGKLRIYDPSSGQVLEAGELEVFAEQENGLIGLALDPDFANNQELYLLYSPPDFSGQRLSRFRLDGNTLDRSSEQVLLTFEEQRRECCHHAGALEFGPDGLLFIATGDNTHPGGDAQGFAPIDERHDRAPFDAQKGPSNTQSLSGKILRIRLTRTGYEIPEGNLFTDLSEGRPEIYVMGCRNPWRIGVDQKTGFVYWGEVGPDAGGDGERGPRGYDEINQARAAGNFGWPYFIADNQPYRDVNFETNEIGPAYDPAKPVNTSPNNTGARILPPAQPAWIYYPYGDSDKFPELNAPGGRTACAGPVYDFDATLESDTKFPAHYDRCLFAFEWSRHWITAVHLDADSNIERLERFLPERSFKRPVDLEFGPDGSLYMLEYGSTWGTNEDSALVRIDYFAGNRSPRPQVSLSGNIGPAPLRVQASTEGSYDPDGDALKYSWRVPPLDRVLSTEANPELNFVYEGSYNLELTLTDPSGASARTVMPVLVGNSQPEIAFASPAAGGFLPAGDSIPWALQVHDAEDGDAASQTAMQARVTLEAAWYPGAFPGLVTAELASTPGRDAMKRSDCFHCHAVDHRVVGPSLMEIANKYRGEHDAMDLLAQRVREGSTGVWGQIPMLPHPQHDESEARQMVSWVLGLDASGPTMQVQRGLTGVIQLGEHTGSLLLTASYTDAGTEAIGPLTARTQLHLRHPAMEAEFFHANAGNSVLQSDTATGGAFVGAINAGSHLRYDDIRLDGIDRVSLRVSSAGSGGSIELRADSLDGPLLAQTKVEPNGAWEDWYEITIPVTDPGHTHDLYIVFQNPNGGGGLMNLDRVCFLRANQSVERWTPLKKAVK